MDIISFQTFLFVVRYVCCTYSSASSKQACVCNVFTKKLNFENEIAVF